MFEFSEKMNNKDIIQFCKDLGCCDACCLRYLGLKNPVAYENSREYVLKLQSNPAEEREAKPVSDSCVSNEGNAEDTNHIHVNVDGLPPATSPPETNSHVSDANDTSEPPAKRCRTDTVCVCCLGILQQETWPLCFDMVKEMLDKKGYECERFACALSAPIATLLRERVVALRLAGRLPHYAARPLTPLKEAWKWCAGGALAARAGRALHAGAPLLVTIHMEYPEDLEELEILKTLSSSLFEARSLQKRRFAVEFTRRSVEQALSTVTLEALRALHESPWSGAVPRAGAGAACVGVECTHAPAYLGGRYVKLSRALPQTPWVLNGVRMMDSSVQEIIFQPIADLFGMSPEEAEHRLKFMSAGREDVDVRCLGEGRPFAIEVADPRRTLRAPELSAACARVSRSGAVLVRSLVYVTREDLVQLKRGEETKDKTYHALCVKLTRDRAHPRGAPAAVTAQDIASINGYRNTPAAGGAPRVLLTQRTPLRVLHRRPLLTRTRRVLELSAAAVPGHACLVQVRAVTQAGTYVKEWAHGDAGRTRPSLAAALHRDPAADHRLDVLALDVTGVHLAWPPEEGTGGARTVDDAALDEARSAEESPSVTAEHVVT